MRGFRQFPGGRLAAKGWLPRGQRAGITAALLASAAVVLAVLGGPVSAAQPTAVVFTGLSATAVDGTTITYGDTKVSVSGQLIAYQTKAPVPGETIAVEYGDLLGGAASTALGTATTGADGTFSATVSLPAGGDVLVKFAGDATYLPISQHAGFIQAVAAPTRITLGPLPALVNPGAKVTLSGKAEVKVGSAWTPLPGASVGGSTDDSFTVDGSTSATTRADGSYALTLPQAGYAYWAAVVMAGPGLDPLYGSALSNPRSVGVIYRTRVSALTVPATREAHQSFPVSGIAQVWNGTKWTGYKFLRVSYFYKRAGTTTWVRAGSGVTPTTASGKFASLAPIVLGHVTWQARVTAYNDGNKFLPSASVSRASYVTDHTCVTDMYGNRAAGHTFVSGWVRDWCANGGLTFGPVKGKLAKLYYRATAAGSWRLLRQARTDANGFADFTLGTVLRGYFKIAFPAQGYYLSSVSKALHLT